MVLQVEGQGSGSPAHKLPDPNFSILASIIDIGPAGAPVVGWRGSSWYHKQPKIFVMASRKFT